MTCGVYIIANTANGKVYVGSSENIERRWVQHRHYLRLGRHQNCYLQRAWNKYGEPAFAFELEATCSSTVLLGEEQRYLDWLESWDPWLGYNIARVAGANMRGRQASAATRQLQSEARRGERNAMYGKHHSEASKQKMREARLGKKSSEETRRKIGAAGKGRGLGIPLKAATKQKLSIINTGKRLSDETKRKISLAGTGRRFSAESRQRMRAARIAWWRRHRVALDGELSLE